MGQGNSEDAAFTMNDGIGAGETQMARLPRVKEGGQGRYSNVTTGGPELIPRAVTPMCSFFQRLAHRAGRVLLFQDCRGDDMRPLCRF